MIKNVMNLKTNIIDTIYILYLIALMLNNLLIGTPLKYNIMYINLLLNIVILITIIYKFIKKKEKISINKIDICVGIIIFSTFLPCIFNKYLRLADSIEYILRYITIFNVYLITRILAKEKNDFIDNVSNILIISSIVLIIFGIDMMTQNKLENIYEMIGIPTVYNESKNRMSSVFKYPNVFAIFLVVCIILSIVQYFNTNKKNNKIVYTISLFMQIFGLIMTYSRLSWIIFIFSILLYYIILKEKELKKKLVKIILFSGINAVIFVFIFNKLKMQGHYFTLYFILIIYLLLLYIVLRKIQKIKISKHLLKILICIIAISLFVLLIYYICSSDILTLFNYKNSESTYRKQNISIEANTQYIIEFDIESKSNQTNNFKIQCKELNKLEEELEIHDIIFDNFTGKKKIEFITTSEAETLTIVFNNTNKSTEGYLKIKNVTINGKNEKINYKFIPIELINRINKIKFDTSSVIQRINYFKESLSLIKQSFFVGQGGYAWKNANISNNITVAEHSYPIQLFIQNGIVSFLSYIVLIIMITKRIINKFYIMEDINLIGIGMSIIILILHSLFDFDMYFLNIVTIFYMFIAIFASKTEKEEVFISYKYSYIYVCFILISIYFSIGEIITQNIDVDEISNYEERLYYINLKIALVPYDYRYREEKINCLSTLKNKEIYSINSEQYIHSTKEIIKQEKYLLNIEKKNTYNQINQLILNYIDIINKNNELYILEQIEKEFNKIEYMEEQTYEAMFNRFKRKYFNKEIEDFLKRIKPENMSNEENINDSYSFNNNYSYNCNINNKFA